MPLPVVTLSGDARQQGRQHGEALRERISDNVAIYFDRFARETQLEPMAVHAIAAQAAQALATQCPEYLDGIHGVAEGSGAALLDIVALNLRYEILYYQFGKLALEKAERAEGLTDGCTAFAVLPGASENGHLLLGQNWDWIPEVRGALLRSQTADGMPVLGFVEAGIVGEKIGLNGAGVALAINGITTTDDDWSRLRTPFHARTWKILRSGSFDAAVSVVLDEPRSCSTNFLVGATPDLVVDIEAAPDRHHLVVAREGVLTHANHFVDPPATGIVEPPNPRRIYSWRREARLRELLAGRTPVSVAGLQDALRDTRDDPFGISRHRNLDEAPEFHYTTVTSIVMDVHDGVLHATDGPPDEGPYQTERL